MTIQILPPQTKETQTRTDVLPTGAAAVFARAGEIVDSWIIDPIDHWRKEQKKFDRVWPKAKERPAHIALAASVAQRVAGQLEALGYHVEPSKPNASWDLLVEGCLRVEVKASEWHKQKPDRANRNENRGRYQANIRGRQTSQADLFVFVAVSGADHYFIIPRADLAGRHSLTIRTYNPEYYTGCLAEFREAWQLVGPALEAAKERVEQGRLEL